MKKRYIVLLSLLVGLVLIFFYTRLHAERETKILLVGDIMLDRTIRKISNSKGQSEIFSCIQDTLKQYDFVVGNLEGPITTYESKSLKTIPGEIGNMTFTFSSSTAETLAQNNFKAVTIANNHIFDFGKQGVEQTRKFLKSADINWFGDPQQSEHKTWVYSPSILSSNDEKIAFVGFNQFLNVDTVPKTITEIMKRKSLGNIVVVFSHWGDEYVKANEFQKVTAHEFIEAGADLVIGSHPHVIQEKEKYKGKMIYYSLGNFIFDQWWEDAVKNGAGVELTVSKTSTSTEISTNQIYFQNSRDGRVCLK